MVGTLLNVGTVLVGTVFGRVARRWLNRELLGVITAGLGIFILALGLSDALASFESTERTLIVLVAIVVGGIIGTALRLQDRILGLGDALKRRTGSQEHTFAEGLSNGVRTFLRGATDDSGVDR